MPSIFTFFFFNDTATTEIYTLSLHDALPICHADAAAHHVAGLDELLLDVARHVDRNGERHAHEAAGAAEDRSEEHTSELQSPCNLVCRLLLEKKNKNTDSSDAALTLYTECTY